MGIKDVLNVQWMEDLGNRKTVVMESEKVAERMLHTYEVQSNWECKIELKKRCL